MCFRGLMALAAYLPRVILVVHVNADAAVEWWTPEAGLFQVNGFGPYVRFWCCCWP